MSTKITISTYLVTGRTNAKGDFKADHGISPATKIVAVNVAIQHANGNWHDIEQSDTILNNKWWNDRVVTFAVESSNFYDREAKALIFVEG